MRDVGKKRGVEGESKRERVRERREREREKEREREPHSPILVQTRFPGLL